MRLAIEAARAVGRRSMAADENRMVLEGLVCRVRDKLARIQRMCDMEFFIDLDDLDPETGRPLHIGLVEEDVESLEGFMSAWDELVGEPVD